MASNVATFSFILLIASMFIVTKARDFDMDAVGMGADFFAEDDHHRNNDRAMGFGGGEDDSFEGPHERNRGMSNVAAGSSFGRHDNGSPFSTFQARSGGGGIHARKGGRNDKQRREPKKRKQDKNKKTDKTANGIWEKRSE